MFSDMFCKFEEKLPKEVMDTAIEVCRLYFGKIDFENDRIETILSICEPVAANTEGISNRLSESIMRDNEDLSKINPFKDIFKILLVQRDKRVEMIFYTQAIKYSEESQGIIKELLDAISESLTDHIIDKVLKNRANSSRFRI